MKILQELNKQLLTAAKNKDKVRQLKLKTIKSDIDLGIKEGRIKTDNDIVTLLNSTLKKYEKSIKLAGESDYAKDLNEDIKIINDLIPEEFKSKVIDKEEAFAIMELNELNDMGSAMKFFKANNYDMKLINGFVKEYLNK